MISKEIEADNLTSYYKALCELQANAHKQSYLLVHDEIRKRVNECETYTEMGINQGATLAAAVLGNPKRVRAYDITLDWYNKARTLFDSYTKEHEIDYEVFEISTLLCSIEPTDVLYIDTRHQYNHVTQELKLHSNKVRKYIIFHDTAAKQGLKRAVHDFVKQNKNWTIITDCNENVGFMTIKNENSNSRIS